MAWQRVPGDLPSGKVGYLNRGFPTGGTALSVGRIECANSENAAIKLRLTYRIEMMKH